MVELIYSAMNCSIRCMRISIYVPDIQISYVSHDVPDKYSEYLSFDFQSAVQQPVILICSLVLLLSFHEPDPFLLNCVIKCSLIYKDWSRRAN